MEFNKCNRCGSFFITNGNLCPNCKEKDEVDICKLENYMKDFNVPESLEQISCNTGISIQNLNRHISDNPEISKLFKL